jgi:hypothetical protein
MCLPIYVFGVFLVFAALAPVLILPLFCALACYTAFLGGTWGSITGSAFSLLLSSCVTKAEAVSERLVEVGWSPPQIAACGLGICVASLLVQLLGHRMCEKLQPPPNLMHGLVCAPSLEFCCFHRHMFIWMSRRFWEPDEELKELEEVFDKARDHHVRLRVEQEIELRKKAA